MYEANKTLRSLCMDYQKIHPCPNNCILYCKEFENASSYIVCKCSRWKVNKTSKEDKKGIPVKVLWYISPILRFKCLFRKKHAKSLLWHDEERVKNEKLRHPANSPAWNKVVEMWPKIKEDLRNLRLGLSADDIICLIYKI